MVKNAVDLHLHSYYSDGMCSPEELMLKAKNNKLKAVSLTDHDTIKGLPEAIKYGKKYGLEVVPGIEISCNYKERELHILGYYFYLPGRLEHLLKKFKKGRYSRARDMLDRLKSLGIELSWEELECEAGDAAPGRVHFARLMVKKGYVGNLKKAFDVYLGTGKPAYLPRKKLDCGEVIEILKESGAVIVLAHPGITGETMKSIRELKKLGIEGIEVLHPEHGLLQKIKYWCIAKKERMLISGGTDFHGDDSEMLPGSTPVTYRRLSSIKKQKSAKRIGFQVFLSGHNNGKINE